MILTGAGISAESGVPTFRGADGFWARFRPEELATPEAFARDPELCWQWYDARRRAIAECEPNSAHHGIVEIESRLRQRSGESSFLLVTQNVDGLHERAGSERVLRLHGSIWSVRCTREGTRRENRDIPVEPLPPVCSCGALLRPDVVWFGEMLDDAILRQAFRAAEAAQTVLVIGTSNLVYPAAALPQQALARGARIVEINPEETSLSRLAHESIRGPATIELPKWWSRFQNDLDLR